MSWKHNYCTAIAVVNDEVFIKYRRIKKTNRKNLESYLSQRFSDVRLVVNYYELSDGSFMEQIKLRPV